MKIDWNKKYNTIAVYSFLVFCLCIVFFNVISKINLFGNKISAIISVFNPFIIGFFIAYILNFILSFYEDKILLGLKFKQKRILGVLLTYLTSGVLLTLFMYFVFPQLTQSITGLVSDVPYYIQNANDYLDTLTHKININSYYLNLAKEKLDSFISYSINFSTETLLPVFANLIKYIASSIWNIVLGLVVSIYLLIDKEWYCGLSKKVTYAIFSRAYATKIIELANRSNHIFGKFISGKILDSFIVGVLIFIVLTLFKMPYVTLISVMMGTTNIIPFFGPFIGAIPSALVVLFISPIKALWFLIIVLVIQQIDANIIEPKILGHSIGISAFWILFAVVIGGEFFGIIGILVGVPLFAVVYSIIREIIEHLLNKKGMSKRTKDYM